MAAQQAKTLLTKRNIGILLAGIVVLVVFISLTNKPKEEPAVKEAPIVQQKPQDCIALNGTGKQTYEIRTGEPRNLQIVEVQIDPIDVKEGETQKITVKVQDKGNNTITKESGVFANIFTDNKVTAIASTAFKLALAQDEESNGTSLITTWEGYWTRDDDYCRTYMETITATNNKGEEHSIDLSFK